MIRRRLRTRRRPGTRRRRYSDRSRYSQVLPLPEGGLRNWLVRIGYYRGGQAPTLIPRVRSRCRCGRLKPSTAPRCSECDALARQVPSVETDGEQSGNPQSGFKAP